MRISHRFKFIFLSNPQCGSTSIRGILDRYSDIKSEPEYPFQHHADAKYLKEIFKENEWVWDDYIKFTTVRSPWDKMVSRYFYGLRNKNSVWHEPAKNFTFEEFLRNDFVIERSGLYSIDQFAYDVDGKCLVDYVLKMEDLSIELPSVLGKLGIRKDKIIKRNSNKKARKHYSYYYTEESAEIVSNLHKHDIRLFNYEYQDRTHSYIDKLGNYFIKD